MPVVRKNSIQSPQQSISLFINIRFFRYTNSHKHKHFQSFFFFSFGHSEPNTLYHQMWDSFTFWLVLTVMYVCFIYCNWGKSLSLNSVTSWFVFRAWKQRTVHWWTPKRGIQWTVVQYTVVYPVRHVHISALPFIQTPALCVRNVRTAPHGFCCQFWQW